MGSSSYHIIVDENIPLAETIFAPLGKVTSLPGRNITPDLVKEADILLVRSVTPVNEQLLADSKVKFVGTATTGTDHVDCNWLAQQGIMFADAKGCNAEAVAEYVVCAVAALQKQQFLVSKILRAGVIGVGRVGSRVVQKLQLLGFTVLQNDPPRFEKEENFPQTDLSHFDDLDLICIHTPLTHHGKHATHHLVNQRVLSQLKPNCIILNAGRGAVIKTSDFILQKYLQGCFDVWEHEPQINLNVLKEAVLATPHIAGYTSEAKLRGTFMLYRAVLTWLNRDAPVIDEASYFPKIDIYLNPDHQTWQDVVLAVYDPREDTQAMRSSLLSDPSCVPEHFDGLRRQHFRRKEFASVRLLNTQHLPKKDLSLLKALQFNIS